jgi:hypothetical protein
MNHIGEAAAARESITEFISPQDREREGMAISKMRRDGRGRDEMADLDRYWFVAAVFRAVRDLVATVHQLRAERFAAGQLIVLANDQAEAAGRALAGGGDEKVRVFPVQAGGGIKVIEGEEVPAGLNAIIKAMDMPPAASDGGDGAAAEHLSQVYAQLHRDVADGALVLIASVADPEEQLLGARIMLRGSCECVLTHELTANSA